MCIYNIFNIHFELYKEKSTEKPGIKSTSNDPEFVNSRCENISVDNNRDIPIKPSRHIVKLRETAPPLKTRRHFSNPPIYLGTRLKRNHTMTTIASVYDIPKCHIRYPGISKSCSEILSPTSESGYREVC